ncbi:MAG: hypothetical protein ACOY3P_25490, partial [Planctomycetota bacterium]
MSGHLPQWIARLLGIDAEPGESIVWTLESRWWLPASLTLLLVLLAVGFIVLLYYREASGVRRRWRIVSAALRIVTVLVLLAMLAQYGLAIRRMGLPRLPVLIDDSLSMTTRDQYEASVAAELRARAGNEDSAAPGPSRWELVRSVVTRKWLQRLSSSARPAPSLLTGELLAETQLPAKFAAALQGKQASGLTSPLGAAVRRVLEGGEANPPAAIVLLSDGINTVGPPLSEAAEIARRRGVPIFAVVLGSDVPQRDVKLSNLLVDDVVFVDDVVSFECQISAVGLEGQEVAVVLREQQGTQPLASMEVLLGPDNVSQPVRLMYRPQVPGVFTFVVEAQPQTGEVELGNNRLEHQVEVREASLRILLAAGYPSYEYRFLRDLLRREETVELHTLLQDADAAHVEDDSSALRFLPLERDQLFAYDAIILADLDPRMLGVDTLEALAEYVDAPGRGGALVLIAGPRYLPLRYDGTPLMRIMPFDAGQVVLPSPAEAVSSQFRVAPTDLGWLTPGFQLGDSPRASREIWASLPPLYWMVDLPQLRAGVRVLGVAPSRVGAGGQPAPVILMQQVGAGRVLFHATDETYRWRYRAEDLYFGRYWIQMLRWLCRSKLAEAGRGALLTADEQDYGFGETVRLRLRFLDDLLVPADEQGVSVALERDGQARRQIAMARVPHARGTFEATLEGLAPGPYRAWLVAPSLAGEPPAVEFVVRPPAGEF